MSFSDFATQLDEQFAALQARLDVQYTLIEAANTRLTAIEATPASPRPPVIPPVAPDSVEFLAACTAWRQNMLLFGSQVAAFLNDPRQPLPDKKDSTYYDGTWVFLQAKALTNDPTWQAAADLAHSYYRQYIDFSGGKIQANWIFPHGLQLYGDIDTVKLLALNASFAPSYPLTWTVSCDYSRESAYNVMVKMVAVALGQPVWGLEEQAQQMFAHVAQWTAILNGQPAPGVPADQKQPTYCRPFMAALTSYGMIEWAGTDATRLEQVRSTLTAFWMLLWTKTFLPQQVAQNNPSLGLCDTLMYTNIDPMDGTGGTQPAHDLNLLIAPVFAWLYSQTHDLAWREKHDKLFIGGVRGGYLSGGKQFNQQYQRSFQGLEWRG